MLKNCVLHFPKAREYVKIFIFSLTWKQTGTFAQNKNIIYQWLARKRKSSENVII